MASSDEHRRAGYGYRSTGGRRRSDHHDPLDTLAAGLRLPEAPSRLPGQVALFPEPMGLLEPAALLTAPPPPGEPRLPDIPDFPDPPRRRLSFSRVLAVLLVLLAVLAAGALALRRAQAQAGRVAPTWFVPYVDATLTPTYSFESPASNPSRAVMLGFVVSSHSSPCTPSWGGAYSLDQAATALDLDRRIAQLRSAGGEAMVSFGGQANSELAVGCRDESALTAAYLSVVDRYHLQTIDLDLEGAALGSLAVDQRRAASIAAVQRKLAGEGRQLAVWVTLPVAQTGLTDTGIQALRTMLGAHVKLAGVNALTMDYGTTRDGEDLIGPIEASLRATHGQLEAIYRDAGLRLDSKQTWNRLGATPMIGQNNVSNERFTIADARRLRSFAIAQHMGRLSIWSLNRDASCGSSFAETQVLSNTCSGVSQTRLQFSRILSRLPPRSQSALTVSEPTPEAIPSQVDVPADSPYPIWQVTRAYAARYKVVWHHDVYQAQWFTQGREPDASVDGTEADPWVLVGPVLPGEHPAKPKALPRGTYPQWSAGTVYKQGRRVLYEGLPYQAKWYTRGESPGADEANPQASPWRALYTIPGEPVED